MTDSELQIRVLRKESFLVASDGQFLGLLSANRFLSDGVMNQYGPYGSIYSSTSIFNKYCDYGSEYSQKSPFNQISQTPPRIYLRGVLVGYLTVNKIVPQRVDPYQLFDYIINNGL